MVHRLMLILRAIAASSDPDATAGVLGTADPSRLAPDYADALLLVTDCPQIELDLAQRTALERIAEQLERLGSDASESPAPTDADRARLRSLARAALRTLGEPHT